MCNGGRCRPNNLVNDNAGQDDNDLTLWQSAADLTCQDQVVTFYQNFTGIASPAFLNIQYDSLGYMFDAMQRLPSIAFMNSNLDTFTPATMGLNAQCQSLKDPETKLRVDNCTLTGLTNTIGMQLTFKLTPNPMAQGRQMNIREIVMPGTLYPLPINAHAPQMGLSVAAIAGIALAVVAIAAISVAAVFFFRNKAMEKRIDFVARKRMNAQTSGNHEYESTSTSA